MPDFFENDIQREFFSQHQTGEFFDSQASSNFIETIYVPVLNVIAAGYDAELRSFIIIQ